MSGRGDSSVKSYARYASLLRPVARQVEREDPVAVVRLERDLVVDRRAREGHRLRRETPGRADAASCGRRTRAAPVRASSAAPAGAAAPKKRTRNAGSPDALRSETSPGVISSRQSRARRARRAPRPQNGPGSRGKSRNSASASGSACSISAAARRSTSRQRVARGAGVHAQQRAGREQRPGEQPGQQLQPLVAQQRRIQQEPGDEDEHREVARRAGLEQLHRRHQHQERGAGLDAVDACDRPRARATSAATAAVARSHRGGSGQPAPVRRPAPGDGGDAAAAVIQAGRFGKCAATATASAASTPSSPRSRTGARSRIGVALVEERERVEAALQLGRADVRLDDDAGQAQAEGLAAARAHRAPSGTAARAATRRRGPRRLSQSKTCETTSVPAYCFVCRPWPRA